MRIEYQSYANENYMYDKRYQNKIFVLLNGNKNNPTYRLI